MDSICRGEIERLQRERDEAYAAIVAAYNVLRSGNTKQALAILRSVSTPIAPWQPQPPTEEA